MMRPDTQENLSIIDLTAISPGDQPTDAGLYHRLASYYIAVLIVIGIIGNVISFILFMTSRQLRRVPSSQYLAALSLTDLTFILCLSLIWLKSFGFNLQDLTVVCPVSIYLSNSSCLLSGWYIMALTAEMTLAIVDPYRARRYCSRGMVAKRIIAIAFVGSLINLWTLVIARSVAVPDEPNGDGSGEIDYLSVNGTRCRGGNGTCVEQADQPTITLECSFNPEHEEYYNNLTILDSVVSFSVPLLVTLTLNITIGFVLLRSFSRRQNLVEGHFRDNVVSSSGSALAVAIGGSVRRNEANPGSRTASHELRTVSNSTIDNNSNRKTVLSPLLPTNAADASSRKRIQRSRVTLVSSLLITKSLIYLALNLPNYVHRLWQMTMSSEGGPTSTSGHLIQLTVYLLFYTQYSLNFFIYSMHACKALCAPKSPVVSSIRRNVKPS